MADDATPAGLPDGVELVRTTPDFDAVSVPDGLRRAHHIAPGVWGVLRVLDGRLDFVWEDETGEAGESGDGERTTLRAGDTMVIPPERRHHVEPADDARFHVEFYRP